MTGERLCHIIERDRWLAAVVDGLVGPATEGFVHLSTAEQLVPTAERWYAGRHDLLVLGVDPEAFTEAGVECRWEESHPGEWFPHAYGHLPLASIDAVVPLVADDHGRFAPPAVLLADGTGVAVSDEGGTVTFAYAEAGSTVARVVAGPRLDRDASPVTGWAHVDDVSTAPGHEGRGLASWLLRRAEGTLAAAGHRHAELWVRSANLRARRLYERLGWSRTNASPALDAEGERIVQYARSLAGPPTGGGTTGDAPAPR